MSKKQKFSPKVKHKAFASFSVKLQDQDWMIGVFNPNDKTATYFLAEPTLPNKNSGPQMKATDHKHTGYLVSALSRQGLTESLFKGLPRKFKAVEDAMEWLESQIEQYDGDNAALSQIADFKSDGKLNNNELGEAIHAELSMQNFSDQVTLLEKSEELIKKSGLADKVKTAKKDEKKLSLNGKEIKPQGPNGAKSTKTAHEDGPYVKPASKFKTSKEELKSLGLDGLFDD